MAILIKKLKKLSLADLTTAVIYWEKEQEAEKIPDALKIAEFISVAKLEIKERIYDLFEETAKTDF